MALEQQVTSVVDRIDCQAFPSRSIRASTRCWTTASRSRFLAGGKVLELASAAATLAIINGAMVSRSAFTDYPGGLWKKISFPMHGALDIVQARPAGLGPVLMALRKTMKRAHFYGQAMSEVGVIAADRTGTRRPPSPKNGHDGRR
jgi:hypothetical protein